MIEWTSFHFLRPWWLMAIPLSLAVLWYLSRVGLNNHGWQKVVDAHLLQYLVGSEAVRRRASPLALLGIAWLFAIIALSGPAWKQLPQPVFRAQAATVVLLDLSRSMDAADVKPSRLARAKFKVLDFLNQIKEGQVALVAYAADPYVVAPLSDDTQTIAAMVPVLETALMPAQGSRLSPALQEAKSLLQQSGVSNGNIIVFTDGLDAGHSLEYAHTLNTAGHRVSVLAIGTAEGAPIPNGARGFVKDKDGGIVISSLDPRLHQLAKKGGGDYVELTLDNTDIGRLQPAVDPSSVKGQEQAWRQASDQWQDEGVWLVFVVLFLAALGFRRGWIILWVAMVLVTPPQPAYAGLWQDLWVNKNNQGEELFQLEKHQEAAETFEDPNWKAASHHRAGNYDKAAKELYGIDTPDAHYNRGNALAREGKLEEAMAAYDAVVAADPQHDDAKFNKALLEKLMQQQQNPDQQGNSSQQDQQSQGQKKSSEEQNGAGQKSKQEAEQQGQQQQQGKGDQEEQQRAAGEQETQQNNKDQADKQQKEKAQAEKAEQQQADSETQKKEGELKQLQQSEDKNQENTERAQAVEQWLGRITDDPGGLLREKLRRQHQRRGQQGKRTEKAW